jgi:hypothetical protein
MNSSNKKINRKIYDVGQKIGLNKKDINNMLNNTQSINEQTSLAAGPPAYPCTLYGTISIKDLQ